MAYKEFRGMLAPSILELQNECAQMNSEEFEDYRKEVLRKIGKADITSDFMNGIFDMIYRNVFQTA